MWYNVRAGGNVETIVFGSGTVTRSKLVELIRNRKYLIVVDSAVHSLYRELFEGLNVFRASAGEEAKSFDSYMKMVSACNISYLTRGGVIIAVGGGALLDAAGFLASTYMRGIAIIKIPTTVIAMCDAAIGGKNAINSHTAKNEIGTFYNAEMIVSDVRFLNTLPEKEMRAGMGEMIKYAIGFAPDMLYGLSRLDFKDSAALLSAIRQAAGIKQEIVAADFREDSLRKTLNFGHTLGHAIEFASNFEVGHGSAVAIGVYAMTAWAHRDGRVTDAEMDLVDRCYDHLRLQKTLPSEYDKNVVFSYVLSDKKMVGNEIDLVKLGGLGKTEVVRTGLDTFYEEVFKARRPRTPIGSHTGVFGRVSSEDAYSSGSGSSAGLSEVSASAVGSVCGSTADARADESAVHPSEHSVRHFSGNSAAVIDLPVSKSYAHRFLILAAFAEVPTVIEKFELSDDVYSTMEALRVISGAMFDFRERELVVIPKNCLIRDESLGDTIRMNAIVAGRARRIDVNCGSSASTARFLIPFSNMNSDIGSGAAETVGAGGISSSSRSSSASGGVTYFYGSASLENRPMNSIINVLKSQGILVGEVHTKSLPFGVRGRLKPGIFRIPGDISSQFLSGLLMAAPKMQGRSKILVTGTQVSKPYVDITLDAMKRMGVTVPCDRQEGRYDIVPARYGAKGVIVIEKDYSQAAFWVVAELLRQLKNADFRQILLPGLNPDSLQGDRRILDFLGVTVDPNGAIRQVREPMTEINLTHYPDLFPILSVFYSQYEKGGVIAGADRVSYKESDRYEAMKLELARLGCRVARENGKFRIYPSKLVGKPVSSHDDHRVAMSLMVLGLFVDGIRIDSVECISKSYPRFVEDFRKVTATNDRVCEPPQPKARYDR